MITQETIDRFFNNQCTPEEATEVKAYIEANPDVLSQLEKEWNEFHTSESLASHISQEWWKKIEKETKPAVVISLYFKRIAVAASIILMFGAFWYFVFHKNDLPKNNIVQVKNELKTISNITQNKMTVRFSDSSIAELMPNSSVTFAELFDSLKREVSLKGEAYFSVTKNPRRPFSVISDSIVTTVLGTKFTVNSYSKEQQIKVILYEGKVMITPYRTAFKGNKKAYYLYPGDVFVYNKKTSEAILQSHQPNNITTDKRIAPGKVNPVMQSDNWYMFNNQPLNEVIDQLEILYNTNIEYKQSDLKGMTFIGKLDKSDSLETILHSIALLNNLQLTRHGNSYLLRK